jgi:hypothetical protein
MKIKPAYITFEQAKWLKEKGFGKWTGDIKTTDYCHAKYFHNKPSGYGLINWKETDILHISGYDNWVNEYPYCDIWTYAPEQWQVVDWLLINHGIWVQVTIDVINFGIKNTINQKFKTEVISQNRNVKFKSLSSRVISKNSILAPYDSPQEAYSAAFDYILTNNLI